METKQVYKKVSFGSEKQALFYIDKLQRTSIRESVPQRAYLCPKCFNWHLTSKLDLKDEFNKEKINNLKAEISNRDGVNREKINNLKAEISNRDIEIQKYQAEAQKFKQEIAYLKQNQSDTDYYRLALKAYEDRSNMVDKFNSRYKNRKKKNKKVD